MERFDVGVHPLLLAVRNEHDAVNTLEDEFARRIVINLSRHGVKVETGLEPANGAEFERHKIEEERAIGFGGEAYELTFRLGGSRVIDILQIRRFTAQARPVVNDLAIYLS